MHEQERWSTPADDGDDARAAGLDFGTFEPVKHDQTRVALLVRSTDSAINRSYPEDDRHLDGRGSPDRTLKGERTNSKIFLAEFENEKRETPTSSWRSRGHLIPICLLG